MDVMTNQGKTTYHHNPMYGERHQGKPWDFRISHAIMKKFSENDSLGTKQSTCFNHKCDERFVLFIVYKMLGTWVVAGPALFAARKTLSFRRTYSMMLVPKISFWNPERSGVYSSLSILKWRFESWKPITHIILSNAVQFGGKEHGNGCDHPRRPTPQYDIHPAYQPAYDHDHDQLDPGYVHVSHCSPHSQQQQALGPKGTEVQRPNSTRHNFDAESNPLEHSVNSLGHDLGFFNALLYSESKG